MKKQLSNEQGFTLIELIMVIAILGILAAAAMPVFQNLVDDAQTAQREGFVGAIRGGINTAYAATIADPLVADAFLANLDTHADGVCTGGSGATACFGSALTYPVTDGSWSKAGNVYTHVATGISYTYNSGTGTFQ